MLPTREQAEALLREAAHCSPGRWDDHSRTAAHCAEAIAAAGGLDAEKAYIVGLLHDIGRKFGKRHLGHASDGYSYPNRPVFRTVPSCSDPPAGPGRPRPAVHF